MLPVYTKKYYAHFSPHTPKHPSIYLFPMPNVWIYTFNTYSETKFLDSFTSQEIELVSILPFSNKIIQTNILNINFEILVNSYGEPCDDLWFIFNAKALNT